MVSLIRIAHHFFNQSLYARKVRGYTQSILLEEHLDDRDKIALGDTPHPSFSKRRGSTGDLDRHELTIEIGIVEQVDHGARDTGAVYHPRAL